MKHLILCREYPPAFYPPGGIGTYTAHIAQALAERGEIVHVIGERWHGAPEPVTRLCDGRLTVHRISAEDTDLYPSLATSGRTASDEMAGMLASGFPPQWFSWVATGLAERLIEQEGIDVIEGQDWEAPLYYLLLRRSLGLGPGRRPPCIVHLHSPTEFIFRHNDWSLAREDYLPMKRMEDHVIKAADAHFCPSHFLARQCETHYGLQSGSIEVVPLPLGDSAPLERTADTWRDGSICYFGRLEPRKGIIEWIDAAVEVAKQRATPQFEFIGADLPYTDRISVRTLARDRIPADVQDRFVFHDARPRAEVLSMLRSARIVAVPSRWENFPNTCLEALCSGVPVLATRNGGMSEMIEHGRTGWLVPDGKTPLADRLAHTLEEALDTSPERLQQMGADAAISIRRFCDNTVISDRHILLRSEVMRRGVIRSGQLPAALPWPELAVRPGTSRAASATRQGIAVTVIALRGESTAATLASIGAQTRTAAHVIVVSDRDHSPPPALRPIFRLASYLGTSTAAAKDLALLEINDHAVAGWLSLQAGDVLEPSALQLLGETLERCPDVGVVSAWTRDAVNKEPDPAVGTCPAFPYQWLWDEQGGRALYRAEALSEVGGIRTEIEADLEEWDLASAVMAAGWKAVRLPALLYDRAALPAASAVAVAHSGARRALLRRFPELVGLEGGAMVALLEAKLNNASEAYGRAMVTGEVAEPKRRLSAERARALALRAARDPRRAFSRLARHIKWRMRRYAAVARNRLRPAKP